MPTRTNHKTVYRQEGRLMLYLGITTKEALKEWAARAGESLNCYVKRAVRRRIDYEKRKAAKAKKKEETTMPLKAYAYRSGEIGFADRVPPGALPILGSKPISRARIESGARRTYDGKTLLVPGVPEAASDTAAFAAFRKWVAWLCGEESANG